MRTQHSRLAAMSIVLLSATVAGGVRAAPEPAIVRLTSFGGGQYLDHGGGNRSTVYAATAAPIDRDAGGKALVTEGPDIWRLVDWNGGRLESGDHVSFATRAEKEPYYLRSTSCAAGARPDTQKRARISSGLTASETFTLHRVNIAICLPWDRHCVPSLQVATAGTPIDNRALVAIETPQGCFLHRDGDGVVRSDRDELTLLAPVPAWQLWYKVIPVPDDDFPGHFDVCFGGVGAACWNNPSLPFSGTGAWRATSSGEGHHTYKEIDVSVGSIAHDNCCLRNPLGKVCGGVFSGGQETKDGTNPGKGVMSVSILAGGEVWQGTRCEWEWQRAIDGTALLNTWTREFGPYYSDPSRACPGCATSGELAWGLGAARLFRRTTNRKAWLYKDLTWKKWITDVSAHYPDGSNEVDNTEAIRAPVGTHIYPAGAYSSKGILGDFCSKKTAYWDVWTTAWVCASIECSSGVASWDAFSWKWKCD